MLEQTTAERRLKTMGFRVVEQTNGGVSPTTWNMARSKGVLDGTIHAAVEEATNDKFLFFFTEEGHMKIPAKEITDVQSKGRLLNAAVEIFLRNDDGVQTVFTFIGPARRMKVVVAALGYRI